MKAKFLMNRLLENLYNIGYTIISSNDFEWFSRALIVNENCQPRELFIIIRFGKIRLKMYFGVSDYTYQDFDFEIFPKFINNLSLVDKTLKDWWR